MGFISSPLQFTRRVPRLPFSGMISRLGIGASLGLCLDAGDVNSYPGSGYQWLDTSGNDYDFNFGADGGPDTDNPTFSGSPGGLSRSEFMSHDGGDFLTGASSNPSFVNAMHKASATWTVAGWMTIPYDEYFYFGTTSWNDLNVGFQVYLWANDDQEVAFVLLNGANDGAQDDYLYPTTNIADERFFFAFSMDQTLGSNHLLCQINDEVNYLTFPYDSPSASDATFNFRIGAAGGEVSSAGDLEGFVIWDRATTPEELMKLYLLSRAR